VVIGRRRICRVVGARAAVVSAPGVGGAAAATPGNSTGTRDAIWLLPSSFFLPDGGGGYPSRLYERS